MTREQLEKYHDIAVRLKELKSTVVSDTVKGSSSSYPYISHSITIHGVRKDAKAQAEAELLEQEKGTVDGFIEGITDIRARNILDWKYRKGMSWNDIAARTGRSHNSEKEYIYRFFKENF